MYKSFSVKFMDGSLNGAVRYYSSLSTARRVARRFVKRPCGGVIFSRPCCEIFGVSYDRSVLLDVIF